MSVLTIYGILFRRYMLLTYYITFCFIVKTIINKSKMKDLNELKDRVYKTACEHGFHEEELSDKHCLMLVITELSEAIEADRKKRFCSEEYIEMMCMLYPYQQNKTYKSNVILHDYEMWIKGSVEEELADVAIRLLSFAGLRSLNLAIHEVDIDFMAETYNNEPFTESIFDICMMPVTSKEIYERRRSISDVVSDMITAVFGLAKSKNIDLLWHIEAKMRYNKSRPYRHGKKY